MKRLLSVILAVVCLFTSASAADRFIYFFDDAVQFHLSDYTEEEKAAIELDLGVVRSVCFSGVKEANRAKPLYIATAGSPGSRKTTILERFLDRNGLQSLLAYIDPDQRGLKFMSHTYYARGLAAKVIAHYPEYSLATKAAYEKWRGASNYIALTLLEDAFQQKKDIAYGTTSTGGHTPAFLAKIKDAGYEICLLLCSCDDSFRVEAIRYRNEQQKFYQSTPEDALSKGKLFPQRMADYFTYADTLHLFWSDDLATPERLAAILSNGMLQVLDAEALDLFVNKYELDRAILLSEDLGIVPSWEELLELYCGRDTGDRDSPNLSL